MNIITDLYNNFFTTVLCRHDMDFIVIVIPFSTDTECKKHIGPFVFADNYFIG